MKYDTNNINKEAQLNDLSGTFDDIGQLISYMRDLSRSLVPLSDNLNDLIENFPDKFSKFLDANQPVLLAGLASIVLVVGYFGTGIVKNIKEIKTLKSR